MDRQHETAKGVAHSESGLRDVCPRAIAPRAISGASPNLLAWVITKLEREQFDAKEGATDRDEGYRRGWSDRSDSLLAELRVRIGLAELRASDVDNQFDFGGEG